MKDSKKKENVVKKQKESKNKETVKDKVGVTFNVVEVIIVILITSLLVCGSTAFVVYKNYDKLNKNDVISNVKKNVYLMDFINSYNHIKESYVEEIDDEKLIDAAIKGMYSYLEDDYTQYIDKESNILFNESLGGKYTGVGVEIRANKNGEIVINRVFDDSPAKKAGLIPGDIFVSVDGESLEGKTHAYLADYIKSSEKTEFTITYKRDGKENTIKIDKTLVYINYVETKVFDNVGYIKIDAFSSTIANQVEKAMKSFDDNISLLIIDVRNNSGGFLSSAYDTSCLFLGKNKTVYSLKDKNGKLTYKKCEEKPVKKYKKIVIITNENSASASEILTAALKENANAVQVGGVTFGKGTVQETDQLRSGAMVKYTFAYWLTPKGKSINKVGIVPTYTIEDNIETIEDEQLNKALEVIKD